LSGKSIRARAPAASSRAVRRVMQAVQQRGTAPEVLLRRAFHLAGLRFRNDCRPERDLRCKADVVFRTHKVCVFVDGCFWHRCRLHFVLPKTNSAWWGEKVSATVKRDRRQTRALKLRGWQVVRVWEHEATAKGIERVVARVLARIQAGTTKRQKLSGTFVKHL
jgi:DNA mismatch endonuclease, patch repair protein